MSEVYHKIPTVFKRDERTNYKTLIPTQFSSKALEMAHNLHWLWTEKVDGTNIRVMFDPETEAITFGGKTDKATMFPGIVEALSRLFSQDAFDNPFLKAKFTVPITLYGEGCGAGINQGVGYSKEKNFVLFDAKINGKWADWKSMCDIAHIMDLERVPIIGDGTLPEMVDFGMNGYESHWGKFPAEGLVARLPWDFYDWRGNRLIAKIKETDSFTPKELLCST